MIKKRGQFYLAAAIVIISILVGFVTITNYLKTSSTLNLNELKEELDIEIGNFLDYIISNDLSDSDANVKFINFSSLYIEKIGEEKNILFLFGDSSSIKIKGFNDADSGNLSINVNGTYLNLNGSFEETYSSPASTISIMDGEDNYSSEILEGKNFYYLVSKLDGDEKQVITS